MSLALRIHSVKAFWAFQSACRKGSVGTNRYPTMSHSQGLLCPASSGSGHPCRTMWQLSPSGSVWTVMLHPGLLREVVNESSVPLSACRGTWQSNDLPLLCQFVRIAVLEQTPVSRNRLARGTLWMVNSSSPLQVRLAAYESCDPALHRQCLSSRIVAKLSPVISNPERPGNKVVMGMSSAV